MLLPSRTLLMIKAVAPKPSGRHRRCPQPPCTLGELSSGLNRQQANRTSKRFCRSATDTTGPPARSGTTKSRCACFLDLQRPAATSPSSRRAFRQRDLVDAGSAVHQRQPGPPAAQAHGGPAGPVDEFAPAVAGRKGWRSNQSVSTRASDGQHGVSEPPLLDPQPQPASALQRLLGRWSKTWCLAPAAMHPPPQRRKTQVGHTRYQALDPG